MTVEVGQERSAKVFDVALEPAHGACTHTGLVFIMRFTTYTKYKGGWLDALNLENLMEMLSEFLLDGGFAGGPHFHPYWGWSGMEDTSSLEALKRALLQALMESGELTPEMVEELRGEGPGNPEVQQQIAELPTPAVSGVIRISPNPGGSFS